MVKIVQVLENSNILPEGVRKAVKNETKKQEGGFLGTLISTLRSILLDIYYQWEELKELVLRIKNEKEL